MEKAEYMEKANEVVALIEKSNFFDKFAYKHHWTSGSQTIVYPIQHWVPNKEIEIQLHSENNRGRSNSAKSLIGKIDKLLPIKYWGFSNYDGSCPQTLYIYFK